MGGLLRRVSRRGALTQIRYVAPIRPKAAPEPVRAVYSQVERDFGMLAPPVALHAPAPEVLAACWAMLRETLIVGTAPRADREAVAAGVSLGNTCPYCVQVHATLLHGLAVSRDAAAIAAGRLEEVGEERIRRLALWARETGRREAGEPPFPADHAAELIGVAVTFHYLNRMVNVFLGEPPIPARTPGAARELLMRALGGLMRGTAIRPAPPGAALDLLPPAQARPADRAWATGTGGRAVAAAATAVEAAGRRCMSDAVRDLVTGTLAHWDGRPPALGNGWLDTAVIDLPAGQRPVARLALATALASYRIGPSDIEAVRLTGADDRTLIEITSWASLAAARRVGSRLLPASTADPDR